VPELARGDTGVTPIFGLWRGNCAFQWTLERVAAILRASPLGTVAGSAQATACQPSDPRHITLAKPAPRAPAFNECRNLAQRLGSCVSPEPLLQQGLKRGNRQCRNSRSLAPSGRPAPASEPRKSCDRAVKPPIALNRLQKLAQRVQGLPEAPTRASQWLHPAKGRPPPIPTCA
jgi:hypothetical protein